MAAVAANKKPTGADGIEALPEELLFEVFSRVGSIRDLFMFAVVCRRWLHRFTDPAFLRGICPGPGQGHRSRLLGFFSQPTRFVRCERMMKMRTTQRTSVSAPTFRPVPGSPLGRTDRALTSLVADDDGTFNYAEPLAARRGVVLMRLVPRTFVLHGIADTRRHLLFGLCNPLTGERHVFPPTCFGHYVACGYAIVTAADGDLDAEQRPPPPSSGRSTFSQLLLMVYLSGNYSKRYLQSYSAATGTWSAPAMCLDGRRFELAGESSAAVHRGAAHWLCIDHAARALEPRDDHYLYRLSAELGGTARVSLTRLPIRAGGKPHLCVGGDGKLSVACVYPVHVTVWTQQDGDGDDGGEAWLRTRVIRMPAAVPDPNGLQRDEEWFELSRGSMLVLYRGGGAFVVDLGKGVMEKVMDCSPRQFIDRLYHRYVPYEMDLVEFFVSCLGRWSCTRLRS